MIFGRSFGAASKYRLAYYDLKHRQTVKLCLLWIFNCRFSKIPPFTLCPVRVHFHQKLNNLLFFFYFEATTVVLLIIQILRISLCLHWRLLRLTLRLESKRDILEHKGLWKWAWIELMIRCVNRICFRARLPVHWSKIEITNLLQWRPAPEFVTLISHLGLTELILIARLYT